MRTISNGVLVAACAALFPAPALWAAGKLSQSQIVAIVASCERLEHDYAYYRDHHDADGFAAIFTENGEWGRSTGTVLKGHKAIHDYIVKLDGNPPELHRQQTTTVQIKPIDAHTATGVSYALVLQGPVPADGQTTPNDAFQVASESRSLFKLDDSGDCKIAKREYTTYFVDSGEARKNEKSDAARKAAEEQKNAH